MLIKNLLGSAESMKKFDTETQSGYESSLLFAMLVLCMIIK